MCKNYLIDYYPNGWLRVYSYYDEELIDGIILQKDEDIKYWWRDAFCSNRFNQFDPISNRFIFGYSNSWFCWIRANTFREAVNQFFDSYNRLTRKTKRLYEI